jgi:hypothetical protein
MGETGDGRLISWPARMIPLIVCMVFSKNCLMLWTMNKKAAHDGVVSPQPSKQ